MSPQRLHQVAHSRTTTFGFSFPNVPRLLLLLLTLLACNQAFATTYYVRTDGGDTAQCTGRGDAAYPGSGSNQACAWKSLHYALPASGAARIAGGDTVIVGAGSYMIGWGAPGAAGGRCYAGGPYDCYLPPIPSGPSVTSKTRILGRGYDTGCTAAPKLWGNNRVTKVLNLEGSSNVEVACLEITDQSDCIEFHSNAASRCERDTPPYGAWASIGVSASASAGVWLHDLNIHGLANRGFVGGGLSNWTLDRVKINANGWAGWDGDIGSGSSNSGSIVLRHVEIAWNGCGERWQTGVIHGCWAQTNGGYGDGLGTALTGGQWLIEDSFVHNNTSDGIDLLYLDGAANTSAVIRRVYSAGNAGNQIKTKGNATIENSVVVGNCASFLGRDFMASDDQCRALGNTVSIAMLTGNTVDVRNNTIIGEGDCLLLSGGGTSTSHLNIQNNALIGQLDWRSNLQGNTGELTCAHYVDGGQAVNTYAKNLIWNVKANQCPAGSVCGQNPKLTNMAMVTFDAAPLAGSPLIDKAMTISGLINDFLLQPRPSGPAPDIGAIEAQSAPPPPVCTRGAPTLGVTGPTTAVAAGTQSVYTVTLRNNDSAVCASTTFNLARTVPSGWSGTLANTMTLAPGASANATLQVTSATNAAAGSYGIGVGIGSSVGAIHTASASATYIVSATIPAPVLTAAITLDKANYSAREAVAVSLLVRNNGVPVAGVAVSFAMINANRTMTVRSAVSGSDGIARSTMNVPGGASGGIYKMRGVASSGVSSATSNASFSVL
ncbi:MAG: NEW3 domain-containing protein [Luteimonas sp.]